MLDGDPAPPQKGAEPPPQFSTHFYCGQRAGCIKMPLGMDVGLSPGDFVLDRDPRPNPPSQKKGRSPKFSAHIYCGQTAGWIKMPLGTKVGLSPGDSVLDGDPAPSSPQRWWSHLPNFWPISIVAKRLDASNATWYGGRSPLRGLCVRWRPCSPSTKGGGPPQIFGPCLL